MSIYIKLPTGDFDIEDLREFYADLKDSSFKFSEWKSRPALIEKNRKASWLYTGQNYDPKFIDLVEDGWTHDDCYVCSKTITDTKNEYTETSGYSNGLDWVCKDCYEIVIDTDDLEKRLSKLPQYEK